MGLFQPYLKKQNKKDEYKSSYCWLFSTGKKIIYTNRIHQYINEDRRFVKYKFGYLTAKTEQMELYVEILL
jgi:hypothetical protein